jgi:3-deoxy-7-phosphoheptulonate synthase
MERGQPARKDCRRQSKRFQKKGRLRATAQAGKLPALHNFMLIVMKPGAAETEIERVTGVIREMGFGAHRVDGLTRISIALTGNESPVDGSRFEHLPGVAEIVKVTKPYRLVTRLAKPENTIVKIGNSEVGGNELTIIGGVCAVESREQTFAAAETVKKAGGKLFRGGAFKPRTSPYAFQGLGEEGLQILAEVREQFGLDIVTEAMDDDGVGLVEKYAQCIQIGARNMQNFSLLKRVGRSHLPVLLKRGMSATLDDLLLAAEYILAAGNPNVILCERGIRTFANHSRNTLDLSIVPAVQKISHLPILVDPSHGTGKQSMVTPLARAAVAVGADGLLIELHPDPSHSLSDGSQALTLGMYGDLVAQIRVIHEAMTPVRV